MADLRAESFKEQEQQVHILIFHEMVEADVDPERLAQFPGMRDRELVVKWEPVSFRLRDGSPYIYDRLSITNNAISKTANFLASVRQVTGVAFDNEADLTRALAGSALKTQMTPVPGMRANKDGTRVMYRKVLGWATPAEVAEARSKALTNGPQTDTAVSTENPADLLFGVIGDGATFFEARDRVIADDSLRSNSYLTGGLMSKALFQQLIDEGRITQVGDRYVPARSKKDAA